MCAGLEFVRGCVMKCPVVPCRCEEGERGWAGCSLGTAIPGYPCGRREGTMPGSVRAVESNNPMFNTHRQQLQNQGRCWIDFS